MHSHFFDFLNFEKTNKIFKKIAKNENILNIVFFFEFQKNQNIQNIMNFSQKSR